MRKDKFRDVACLLEIFFFICSHKNPSQTENSTSEYNQNSLYVAKYVLICFKMALLWHDFGIRNQK